MWCYDKAFVAIKLNAKVMLLTILYHCDVAQSDGVFQGVFGLELVLLDVCLAVSVQNLSVVKVF